MRTTLWTLAVMLVCSCAFAQQLQVLYSFGTNPSDGTSQVDPVGGVILDSSGNVYGATAIGGTFGMGTVFEISNGVETILHSFSGDDGEIVNGGLVLDANLNLYGTTQAGGTWGDGILFELSPNLPMTTVYTFGNGYYGRLPDGGLMLDALGNFYGTTSEGGSHGHGTAFKLSPQGTILSVSYQSTTEGPYGNLVPGKKGWVYGMADGSPDSVIYEINMAGEKTVLHSFTGKKDGGAPALGVMTVSDGTIYWASNTGGGGNCYLGCGVVFKLTATGTQTVLYSFTGGQDGAVPTGVVRDAEGNLYGAAAIGGDLTCNAPIGCGTIFKLDTAGTLSVLYDFENGASGYLPYAPLIMDGDGNLYGTTFYGGDVACGNGVGCGVVFEIVQ